MHSVTVWASEYGLPLCQVAWDEKSNEITAIPESLQLVDVSGGVVTIDAMGLSRRLPWRSSLPRGDYLPTLKGKRGRLPGGRRSRPDAL